MAINRNRGVKSALGGMWLQSSMKRSLKTGPCQGLEPRYGAVVSSIGAKEALLITISGGFLHIS